MARGRRDQIPGLPAGSHQIPADHEAERAVLGAILLDNDALPKITAKIEPQSFELRRHRILYETYLALAERQQAITLISTKNHLRAAGLLEKLGGAGFLAEVADAVPTAAHIETHAQVLADLRDRRELIRASETLTQRAYSGGAPVDDLVADFAAATDALSLDVTWPETLPFDADLAGPPCPTDALPSAIRRHVEESAASSQVPPCMAAAAALAVLAAAAARRARVAVGQTHVEPLNAYVATIASPGERKSAALRQAVEPLDQAQRERVREMEYAVAENRQQREVAAQRVRHLQVQAAKAETEDARARLIHDAAEAERTTPDELVPPRLYLDDATPEALVRSLAEQGGKIAIISEEGGTLIGISAGRYERNGAPNVDALLKGYDGGSIRVDRVSRQAVEVLEPALTIAVMLQPSMLDRIAEVPDLRGRGLLGRFLFVWPESLVGSRMYHDREISSSTRQAYIECVKRIQELDAPADSSSTLELSIKGAALEAWRTYADALELEQREGGALADVRDWASKHAGRAARIAGLFHLCRHAGKPIPTAIALEDVNSAIRIARWLEGHAKAVFARIGTDADTVIAKRILRWIREERDRTDFTLRDVHRLFRGEGKPEDYLAPLRVLEVREFIRETGREPSPDIRKRGRKKSVRFAVNPVTHDRIARIDRNARIKIVSVNSGNSVSGTDADDGEAAL